MDVVVLVKHVPDATGDRRFRPEDATTDRDGVDGLLSELDEYAVEEALRLVEAHGGQVTVLTMGPPQAADAVRKALQLGADAGVHVLDGALHGSDAPATAHVLARALERIGSADLVLTGMASTDGGMGVVPAMVAERLGLPHLGHAAEVSLEESGTGPGATVRAPRDGDAGTEVVEAATPAIVSVTDQINEPRYASFKGIMAAKKKPVQTWSLADLGIDPGEVGLAAAGTAVHEVHPAPPRGSGEVVVDDGQGGVRLAEFLAARRFV